MEARRGKVVRSPMFAVRKSGRGQPHSKTSRKHPGCVARASVVECGCPLPLSLEPRSADRTLQSHPACTVELRFETFGNFAAACEQRGEECIGKILPPVSERPSQPAKATHPAA